MKLRTAAYMAISIHFLRELSRKILSSSREAPGRTLARDLVLIATPTAGVYAMTMIRVAKIAKGADLSQYYTFLQEARKHFDKCDVRVMWADELEDRKLNGARIYDYGHVHESILSTDRMNSFYVSKVLRDMPLSFLKHLEMY